MDLSIVIPAFNEARKIARDVELSRRFLIENHLSGEIIIADDGSTDGTAELAEKAEKAAAGVGVEVRILRLAHRGKGSAVRGGMNATRGEYCLFADSGVCVPFSDALVGLELLRAGRCDIANGSRKLPGSVIERSQSLYRRVLSRLFRSFVRFYLDLPGELTDTQCGFKMYRGDVARELYRASVTDGFMFDLEVLMRAETAGYRVAEFPIHWTCDPDSRLKPARLLKHTLADLRELKRRLKRK